MTSREPSQAAALQADRATAASANNNGSLTRPRPRTPASNGIVRKHSSSNARGAWHRVSLLDALAWASLLATTGTCHVLARMTRSPTPASFFLAWFASELSHLVAAWQASTLIVLGLLKPEMMRSWAGRALLLLNAASFSTFVYGTLEALSARGEFRAAMQRAGITWSAKSGSDWKHMLLALLPVFAVARRGKTLRLVKSVPYASLPDIDPELVRQTSGHRPACGT